MGGASGTPFVNLIRQFGMRLLQGRIEFERNCNPLPKLCLDPFALRLWYHDRWDRECDWLSLTAHDDRGSIRVVDNYDCDGACGLKLLNFVSKETGSAIGEGNFSSQLCGIHQI